MKNSRCIFVCLIGVITILHDGVLAGPTREPRYQSYQERDISSTTSVGTIGDSKYNKLMTKALENMSYNPKEMGRNLEDFPDVQISQRSLVNKPDQNFQNEPKSSVRQLENVFSESVQFMSQASSQVGRFFQTFSERLISAVIILRGFVPRPVLMIIRLILSILLHVFDNVCFITRHCHIFNTLERIAEIL